MGALIYNCINFWSYRVFENWCFSLVCSRHLYNSFFPMYIVNLLRVFRLTVPLLIFDWNLLPVITTVRRIDIVLFFLYTILIVIHFVLKKPLSTPNSHFLVTADYYGSFKVSVKFLLTIIIRNNRKTRQSHYTVDGRHETYLIVYTWQISICLYEIMI